MTSLDEKMVKLKKMELQMLEQKTLIFVLFIWLGINATVYYFSLPKKIIVFQFMVMLITIVWLFYARRCERNLKLELEAI